MAFLALPAIGMAQVPVDEDGEPIGEYAEADSAVETGNEDIPLLSAAELDAGRKNAVSHRGRAVRALAQRLTKA